MKKKIEQIKKILGSDTVYVRMPEAERLLHKNVLIYKTIGEALVYANRGCVVKVYGGVYRENLEIRSEVTI
jgi:hypothetical protein